MSVCSEWISVEDFLPPEDTMVLVRFAVKWEDAGDHCIFYGQGWVRSSENHFTDALHSMKSVWSVETAPIDASQYYITGYQVTHWAHIPYFSDSLKGGDFKPVCCNE